MNAHRDVVVLGSGGFAKLVVRTLQDAGHTVAIILDDDRKRWGGLLLDIPIVGPLSELEKYSSLPAVIAIGNNATRRSIDQHSQHDWMTVVHPSAIVDPTAKIGQGTIVSPGVVIQADAFVGDHVYLSAASSISHDCTVSDYVHLGPGARLAGGVTVGEGAMLGIGSVAIPGVRIGAWTTVGAGAAVVRDLPDRVVAMGVPARVKRRLDDNENGPDGPQPNG